MVIYIVIMLLKINLLLKTFCKRNSTANSFVVDTSRVIFNPPSEMQQQIIDAVEKLAQYLNLKDGLIHSQFIWDEVKHT